MTFRPVIGKATPARLCSAASSRRSYFKMLKPARSQPSRYLARPGAMAWKAGQSATSSEIPWTAVDSGGIETPGATGNSYRGFRERVRSHLADMPDGDQAMVMGVTAARLLGFDHSRTRSRS
jgi:hypothetical protein